MNSLLEKMRRTWYSITTYEKLEMMHLEKSDKNDIDHPSAAAFALYDQHLSSYHVLSLTTFVLNSEKVDTPMRAILISDQHDHIFRDDNEELIDRILELEPDIVFMDGDMLNADSDDISWLLSEIERLSAKVPVYYALGNHELAYMHPLITDLKPALSCWMKNMWMKNRGNAVRIGGFSTMRFRGPQRRAPRYDGCEDMRSLLTSAIHRG